MSFFCLIDSGVLWPRNIFQDICNSLSFIVVICSSSSVDVGQLVEPCKSGVLIAFIFSVLLSLLGYQNYPFVNFLGLTLIDNEPIDLRRKW